MISLELKSREIGRMLPGLAIICLLIFVEMKNQ
jgi:hypothetical protein